MTPFIKVLPPSKGLESSFINVSLRANSFPKRPIQIKSRPERVQTAAERVGTRPERVLSRAESVCQRPERIVVGHGRDWRGFGTVSGRKRLASDTGATSGTNHDRSRPSGRSHNSRIAVSRPLPRRTLLLERTRPYSCSASQSTSMACGKRPTHVMVSGSRPDSRVRRITPCRR
jgi:hypothetical protein